MRPRRIAPLGVILLVALLAPLAASAQDAEWKIAAPKVFGTLIRPAVRFTHAAHQTLPGVSCLTCHHVFVKGKNVLDPATLKAGDPSLQCAACHARPLDLEARYHQLCVGCHDTARGTFGVTGPRVCGECHARER
jgi:hypothetical protein